jgi:hypothetical protein
VDIFHVMYSLPEDTTINFDYAMNTSAYFAGVTKIERGKREGKEAEKKQGEREEREDRDREKI